MSEEFIREEEYNEYKFKIYLLGEYDKHTCSVYVISKSDEVTLFTERTIISQEAKMIGRNIIKKRYPKVENQEKFLIKKLIEFTFKNAKDRINSKDFEKGEIYTKEISDLNVVQWLDKIEREYLK